MPEGSLRIVADERLRSVDEHLSTIMDGLGTLDSIELPLLDAQGLLLAEHVRSSIPLPGFDNSAMDGYALRAVDVRGASEDRPVVLPVVGDVAAGVRTRSGMSPGVAMRIMTGAPVPAGADAVIPLEDTDRGVAKVAVRRPVRSGECVRRAGEDLPAGAAAVPAGAALGPQQIALLAALGRDRVVVRPRPRVVVISTGSELVEVGAPVSFGEVHDANSYLLAAAARDAGADAYRVGIVPDDHARLLDVLESQLLRADVLVTSGGVSMGAYDVVKEALSELGTVEFTRVAMQPGMPQGYGHLVGHGGDQRVPIFCLPGNPVSSLVSFEVFVRPAIRTLLGKRNVFRATVAATALESADSPRGSPAVPPRDPAPRGGRAVLRVLRRRPGLAPARRARAGELPRGHRRRRHGDRRGGPGHRGAAAAVQPMTAHPGWPVELHAGPVVLRPPRLRDGRAWSEVRLRNEEWLAPWEPSSALPWSERNAVSAWPSLASALRKAGRTGTMLPFVITYSGRLVGTINASNIVHGVLRSCTVGYWVDRAVAGRGITPTALALVVDHCFYGVGLHRVEVDIRPENAPSLRVVEKLGLRREGFYERYLDIDGGWRDHVAFAITVEELHGSRVVSRLPPVRPDPSWT